MNYDEWRTQTNEAYYFNCESCEMQTDLDDICQTNNESLCPNCFQKEFENAENN